MPNGRLWGDGIALDDIPAHVICVLGHYHKHVELRSGRVYYLGSMIQVDKSDAGDPKYFGVYDSSMKDRPLRFFPTKGPRFISIDIDRHTQGYYDEIADQVAGNFVTVKKLPNGFNDVTSVIDMLTKVGARHVALAVQSQFPAVPPELVDTESGISPVQVVEEYVEHAETPLDSTVLKEVGVRVVQHVGNTIDRGDRDIDAAFDAMIAQDV
jgi:DNA repair exonuclease SbcCD nuclease subunit